MMEMSTTCLPMTPRRQWIASPSRRRPPLTLHLTVQMGDLEMIAKLVSRPVVNAKDSFGNTPLIYAVKNGCADIVTLLVGYGAEVNCSDTV